MDSPSCLDDPKALLVADTSVIINLNASRRSEDILDILPNRIVVVEEVLHELEFGRRQGWSDADALSALASALSECMTATLDRPVTSPLNPSPAIR